MLRLSSHTPMLDVREVRAAMREPGHGPVSMGAIITRRSIPVPESVREYHERGGIPYPEENTRETFADLALELGLREISREDGMCFVPLAPLSCEQG